MWRWLTRKSTDRVPPSATPAGNDASSVSSVHHTGAIAEIETVGQTAVATLTVTELTGLEAASQLADLLEQLHQTDATNFVLDIQNIQQMDSASLAELVRALQRLEKKGGRLALVNTDRSVSYLFKLTKLDRVFPICRDVMSALTAVERPARNNLSSWRAAG